MLAVCVCVCVCVCARASVYGCMYKTHFLSLSKSMSKEILIAKAFQDETGAYYTEWSKPERKTPIQYTNAYIWNLERW